MNLSDLHFLRPLWLLLLLALPLLVWLLRRREARENGWQAVVDAGLLAAQSERAGRRSSMLPLALLAAILAILALAGPAFRELPQPLIQREAPLAIALSLSPTLHAEDLKPNRLSRARFKIADLLRERRDGQFALLAYADDAYTVAPVTDDGQTLLALLDSLDVDVMPKPGNRPARAIRHAMELLQGAGFEGGDILLVADGVAISSGQRDSSLEEAEQAAEEAASAGFHVSVLGVGTDSPGPVPMPAGGFLKDSGGGILLPKLDGAALQSLSAAGNGAYQLLRSDAGDLRALGLLDAGNLADAGTLDDNDADQRRTFQDEGPWLLLLLLPLAAAGFRRGWVASLALLLFMPMSTPSLMATPASAPAPVPTTTTSDALPTGNSWWRRDDQRAWDALQAGDNAAARALATDPAVAASAAYRAGDFASAAQGFGGDSADAHYNRGNALARQDELQASLDAYDQALALDPSMEDAQVNRDLVDQALQQHKQQEDQNGQFDDQSGEKDPNQQGQQSSQEQQGEQQDQQDQQQGQQGESSDDGEQQQKDDPSRQDGDKGDEQDSQSQQEDGEQDEEAARQEFQQAMEQALEDGEDSKQETRAMTEAEREQNEQDQAVEQWLRRVPDDPGGLLRRKFQIEHQRRQREGGDR
ncbi:MAG: VWA domain-containing protein [Xanthomonadales bacterium]|nr:VWA domain-containing protein [Xanthomonadales bacterium]